MQILLDTVREEAFTWQEQLTVQPDRLGHPDLIELGPISVEGRIEYFEPDFRLLIRYRFEARLSCSRCLKPMDEAGEGEIDLIVEVAHSEDLPEEVELEDEDLGVVQAVGEELDTEPIVASELPLSLPMKPLCRSDCKGLCGGCGADLNHDTCRCEKAPSDPRWEALAAIRQSIDDKNKK